MTALVLVIEDNPINAELVVSLLRAFGYQALTTADGRAGLEAARLSVPDLILCDIQMPVLDGFEFARIAKADLRLQQIPLLAVTASAMVGDRDRILAAGFDDYIAKPIDPLSFARHMARLLPVDAAPPVEASSSLGAVPVGRRRSVLVLDDTEFNRELKRDLLEPQGWSVLACSSIGEAIEVARREPPDLFICDVGLRDGHGLDFLALVKADPRLARTPFVFLTATHWERSTELTALSQGADAYLRRPMEPCELLSALEACMARR